MKIAEVSEQYGISSDTLRYYERIGLIPPVNRSESGIRDYNELDLRRVEFIKCMRSAGLPVEVLIEYVGLVQQGDKTVEARKEILKEQRELLMPPSQSITAFRETPRVLPNAACVSPIRVRTVSMVCPKA
jgi:DNA-binding transcriptional MerR regulator